MCDVTVASSYIYGAKTHLIATCVDLAYFYIVIMDSDSQCGLSSSLEDEAQQCCGTNPENEQSFLEDEVQLCYGTNQENEQSGGENSRNLTPV